MKEIEKFLMERKKEIDKIVAPDKMEKRLEKALDDIPTKKYRKFAGRNLAIVASIAFLLIIYNFDVLAYCGKTLLGYDNVMNGTLQELNNLGEGQKIGKSHTFKNGLKIVLDGIMVDGNQLIAFYRVSHDNEKVDEIGNFTMVIKGFLGEYYPSSGQGEISENGMEVKWVHSFEKPSLLEKNLHLKINFIENGYTEIGDIEFRIDLDKAMGNTLKQKIDKKIESDGVKIKIDSISASPTETIIDGTIASKVKLIIDQITGERFRPNDFKMNLIANGEKIEHHGRGISTDNRGIKFSSRYDALPHNLKTLQLEIKSFSVDKDVEEKIVVDKNINNESLDVIGKNIVIKKLYEISEETYVDIATKEDIVLTKVSLVVDGEKVSLKETINSRFDKTETGEIIHNRTLHFPAKGKNYEFYIERISYENLFDKIIEIPIK